MSGPIPRIEKASAADSLPRLRCQEENSRIAEESNRRFQTQLCKLTSPGTRSFIDNNILWQNSDYDLYSRGMDGQTATQFTAAKARDAGLDVIQDRCLYKEWLRLMNG